MALLAALLAIATGSAKGAIRTVQSSTPSGTQVVNSASVAYQDGSGRAYTGESNAVVTTFAAVGAVVVSPKQSAADPATDSFAAGENVTRTFTITNDSNIDDEYTIQSAGTGKGKLVSLQFLAQGQTSDVTMGTTVSPTVHPGGSIQVRVVVATAGVALGTAFPITVTARTTASGTANGLQTDTGEQWALAASAPKFTGAGGADTQIAKTVNRVATVQSAPGATVTFDVVVKNSGGAPAQNVVITDALPQGLMADAATVKMNGTPAGNAASCPDKRSP